MYMYILLLMVGMPLIEIYLLIQVKDMTNLTTTIVLVLLTGIVGSAIARNQGFKIWMRIQHELSQGVIPADSLVDGLIVLMGGCLLITPGILTDVVGFMTLIPFTRTIAREWLKAKFKNSIKIQTSQSFTMGGMGHPFENPGGEIHETDDWQEK